MLKKKAKELQARLVISPTNNEFGLQQEKFVRSQYSLCVSASKSGMQYLDSLGGMASATASGSYRQKLFWIME